MSDAAKLWIGGEWVEGGDGAYPVINPSTEQEVGYAPEASVADAAAAAAAAKAAFASWSRTDPAYRASLLNKVGDLLEANIAKFVPTVQAETGATMHVAQTMQVPVGIARFRRYAAGAMEPTQIPVPPSIMPTTALAAGGVIGGVANRLPVGVVTCITSYNFPITNMAGKICPALAMGNTVIVKPAPQDPLGIVMLMELFDEAGFPPGVVNLVVSSKNEPSEVLTTSPDVDMVSFTGSSAVGSRIMAAGAPTMKRLLLELGGKGASIVFDDADVAAAVGGTASTFAFHSGQICTAPTRVLAHRNVYDQVVSGLKAAAESLKIGDPLAPDTIVGPVITQAHRDRVESMVARGPEEGGTIVTGGQRPDVESGYYVAPTVIADCRPDMFVVREEFFAPVVVVVPFDDDDEAVAVANSSPYGLYDYVWTKDTPKAMAVARQLRTGNVGLNTAQRNFELPFGGFKMSGVNRDGGSFALHCYSELQAVTWQA